MFYSDATGIIQEPTGVASILLLGAGRSVARSTSRQIRPPFNLIEWTVEA
jgi:hypothetical protein